MRRSIVSLATLTVVGLSPLAGPAAAAVPVVPTLPGVTGAPTGLAVAPIPASIGRQGDATFRVNTNVPAAVQARRFSLLVTSSAARWGLRRLGETSARPLRRDGLNVVGFTTRVRPESLGVQLDYVEELRDRRTGRVLRQRITEQDLGLQRRVRWQQGPARPSAGQYDLETVLIHELGHLAGNKGHAPACTNTPMVPTAAPGEWWRAPDDFQWLSCAARARAASTAPSDPPIDHRVVRTVRWIG